MDFSSLRAHARANLAAGTLPGCAWLVAVDGEIAERGEEGYLDYEPRTPLPGNAVFRLASMTKPLTGAAVLSLCEEGKLSLDDPVSRYLPDFAHMGVGRLEGEAVVYDHEAARLITIRHLLSHTSGLGSGRVGDVQYRLVRPRQGDTLADRVPDYASVLLDFDPGTKNSYSGHLGFDLLGYLCELADGRSFAEIVRRRVTDPLETDELTYLPTPEMETRLMKMYAGTPHGLTRFHSMDGLNFGGYPRTFFGGSCAMVGTLDAYFRFAQCLLDGGRARSGARILREESVREMTTPAFGGGCTFVNASESWGLSMRVITAEKNKFGLPRGTFGWSGAYGTHFFLIPSRRVCAVYMMNCTTAGGAGAPTAREFERDVTAALGL